MNDPDLFSAAMAAARYESTGRFADEVLGVDARVGRRWQSGERDLQGTVRVVCDAIVARPELAQELAAARARLRRQPEVGDVVELRHIDRVAEPGKSETEYDPLDRPDPYDPFTDDK